MIKELIGRVLMIAGTVYAFWISWWAPIVAAPIIWKIYNVGFCFTDRTKDQSQGLILDMVTHVIFFAYLILCVVQFGLNIDHWYGWVIGFVVWLIVAQILGLLWPRRWHYERMDGQL